MACGGVGAGVLCPGVGVASAVPAVRTCGGVWVGGQSLHVILGARLWLANGVGFRVAWLAGGELSTRLTVAIPSNSLNISVYLTKFGGH